MASIFSLCSVWNGMEIGWNDMEWRFRFGKNVEKAREKNSRRSIEEESLRKA